MGLDEALLEGVAKDPSRGYFRTYEWTTPTLSLGYFQHRDHADADPRWRGAPIVRRLTGGGAIWHDRELTYAIALPDTHPLAARTASLYRAVHAAIADCLGRFGVNVRRRGEAEAASGTRVRPFLCFADRDADDLVVGVAKVVGSAQRRRRGVLLQHGSILLARSTSTPELPGVNDLAGLSLAADECSALLKTSVPEALGLVPDPGEIPGEIRRRGEELALSVYGSSHWTDRR
jgi:lipoate-protein ligase A